MSHKKYIIVFLAALAICRILVVACWVAIDPYDILGLSHFNKKNFEPNLRIKKVAWLKKQNRFDSYILGSSRANFYTSADASRLSGRDYYNMSVSAEGIDTMRARLKWLIDNKSPRQVIIGLDYDIMFYPINRPIGMSRIEPPEISGDPAGFLYEYFKSALWGEEAVWLTLKDNIFIRENNYRFDVSTGYFWLPAEEKEIAEEPAKHSLRQMFVRSHWNDGGKVPETRFHELSAMCDLLKQNKMESILIINPYNHALLAGFPPEDYLRWLERVVNTCGPVWDFSGYNSVTVNNLNYYDYSHFTKQVGAMVLERIYGCADCSIPDNFGVLATPQNLHLYIPYVKQNLLSN